MKTGRTFEQLRSEVERQSHLKRDFLVPSRGLHMDTGNEMRIGDKGYFGINENAHRQIAAKLQIPFKYYMRMQEDPSHNILLQQNVNHWLQSTTEQRMIRCLDGDMRAMLSDRYRVLDNDDLISYLVPMMDAQGEENHLCSSQVTETHLYFKATLPDQKYVIPAVHTGGKDYEVEAGFTIKNSEVGKSSLQFLPSLHNPHCHNISTYGSRFKKFHLGERLEGAEGQTAWEFFSDETKQASNQAVWLQLRDTIQAAMNGGLYEGIIDKVRDARGDHIEGNIVEAAQEITRQTKLTEVEGKAVQNHFIKGQDFTRFGLSEAITRTAEDVPSYDRASELEVIGAQVIELPQRQWETIAQAE